MTLRDPLVIINGQIQQLPGGDTINGTVGGTNTTLQVLTNNQGSTINKGHAVYVDTANNVKLASANSATATQFIGFVADTNIGTGNTGNIQHSGVLTANTAQWDAVTGETGGLVANQVYYLSSTTAGMTVNAAPTADTKYVKPIGIGLTSTEMLILQHPSILL